MSATSSPRSAQPNERVWPLDLALIVLGGLVFSLIVSKFRFDDPRPLYNAWTYALLVPAIVVGLSVVAHGITSRFLEKSLQLAFLFSVLIHLILLMMAVNMIVFIRYFPEAFTGNEPRRIPVKKTVPDYLFATPSREMTQPDWSKPVDAETTSKEVPLEERTLPPVEKSAQRLEMPKEQYRDQLEPEKALIERQKLELSMPTPANTPGKKARSLAELNERLSPSQEQQSIDVPDVQAQATPAPTMDSRRVNEPERNQAEPSRPLAASAESPKPDMRPVTSPSAGYARPAAEDRVPMIGNIGATPDRVTPQQRERSITAAGAAPVPMSVPVASRDASADRMLSPSSTPLTRTSRAVGASLTEDSAAPTSQFTRSGVVGAESTRAAMVTATGLPSVEAGSGLEATSRRMTGQRGLPVPLGDASSAAASLAADIAAMGRSATGANPEATTGGQAAEPAERNGGSSDGRADLSPTRSNSNSMSVASSLALDLPAPEGILGLADVPAARSGVSITTEDLPKIESLSLRPNERRRLDVGGPIVAAGQEIAAVESFKRRVMRTQGGAAPSPVGLVGPATEEAIERGLAFIASRQLPAGHWSLQGHGEPVILQSDTAATGLCLLAFQGAGYTHQQHQYASTVARGLQALVAMQKPDGNLYRSENPLSDQNVAFYSHGIASLALCEAYGMTRDESLREPAQKAIDYISKSQNRERGGWRYQPQVSADTSVSGWMMMALKSGELAGLEIPSGTYEGIDRWLEVAKASRTRADRYRYNPYAPNTPSQKHGRDITPTMTAVGILMRMYSGWTRENPDMRSAADYLAQHLPAVGDVNSPQRDTYYWYYATQVMFHMGGDHWKQWNEKLNPILVDNQVKSGPQSGSWDPVQPVEDRWSKHAGRLYLTTMNLLSLEVYYRHLPIYEDTAK